VLAAKAARLATAVCVAAVDSVVLAVVVGVFTTGTVVV
jgi:hypothetical protein